MIAVEKNAQEGTLKELYKKISTLKQSMSEIKGKIEHISVSITETADVTDMDSMVN